MSTIMFLIHLEMRERKTFDIGWWGGHIFQFTSSLSAAININFNHLYSTNMFSTNIVCALT